MDIRRFPVEDLLGPLNEIEKKNAPRELFVLGREEILSLGACVAIVGSRKASDEGLARAARLARMLAERGIVVVSGLAEGIDTSAHVAAMEAGGRTVAVIGTAPDACFPASNRELQDRIARDHLVVSQFAPGTSVGRKAFPMRNRTMALLTDATVIVEASASSGTLHQGWEALRLGRPLFLMESLAAREDLEWPAEMMTYGAEVLSDGTFDFFLEMLPESSRVERARLAL